MRPPVRKGDRGPRAPANVVRLLHFSDTHLGHQQYARTDPVTGINQREQDHYDAFAKVIEHAVTTRPDVVIHAGDLFDGVRPSNRALSVALEGFLRLSRAGIPVVCIAGNHEHPKLTATGSPFALFGHLSGVYPVHKSKLESIDLDGLRIHAVPQCMDNEALEAEIRRIQPTDGVHDVLVVHGAVHSLESFRHAEFNELSLDPAWFDERFSYVALGHFHSRAKVTANAQYCGAPDRVSIAEAGEQKGVLEVELTDGRPDVHFQAIPGRTYADLPVLQADGMDGGEVLAAAGAALQRVAAHAIARLRIRGLDPSLRGVLNQKGIRDAAAHLLHLDLRLEWQEDAAERAGSGTLHGLGDEFEAFVATYPSDTLNKKRLVALARDALAQAQDAP